jgi:hypothetical protein
MGALLVPAEQSDKGAEIIYSQTAKVAEIFWEWRHKVITRFFATIGGVLLVAGWFYKEEPLRRWSFVPLVLGAAFAIVSHLLDRVNDHILLACYNLGSHLEEDAFRREGIFFRIKNVREKGVSYFGVLRITYLATAALLVAIAISVAVVAW